MEFLGTFSKEIHKGILGEVYEKNPGKIPSTIPVKISWRNYGGTS